MRFESLWLMGLICLTSAVISSQNDASQHASFLVSGQAPPAERIQPVDTSEWKTYRNEQFGFELKYPETWGVGGEGSGVHSPTGQPAQQTEVWVIELRKPHQDGEPEVKVSLGLQENANPKKLSIDEYVAEQLNGMKTTPASSVRLTVGGRQAVFFETTSSTGTKLRATYILLHETEVMTFIYKHQQEFDPTLAAIVSSFRVIK